MVTADWYSGYIWVDALRDTSTKAIIDTLDRITCIFGIPISCRPDWGTPVAEAPSINIALHKA